MNFGLSYNNLEQKIQDIKSSLNSFCDILNQYQNAGGCLEIGDLDLDNVSVTSYFTAPESLSFTRTSSYVTAVDQMELDDPEFEPNLDSNRASSTNTLLKKSVSFSKYVTVLEVYNSKKKRIDKRDQISHLKGKFIDYIHREKFYIKYKWQKFKNKILNSNRMGKNCIQNELEFTKPSFEETLSNKNLEASKIIDIKEFFRDFFLNSFLETDLDGNSITIVKKSYTVSLTDFNKINSRDETESCQSPVQERIDEVTSPQEANKRKEKYDKEQIQIKPKLYKNCTSVQKMNAIENNVLLKYLISKAQYPIQLKVATSIVKLNLPQWYQSSLIV